MNFRFTPEYDGWTQRRYKLFILILIHVPILNRDIPIVYGVLKMVAKSNTIIYIKTKKIYSFTQITHLVQYLVNVIELLSVILYLIH